jgi:LysM domain
LATSGSSRDWRRNGSTLDVCAIAFQFTLRPKPLLTIEPLVQMGTGDDQVTGVESRDGGELMGIFDKNDDKPTESRPDFRDVSSGGSSTAPAATQPPDTIGSGKTYVVVEGDSLSKIAKREYGNANKWRTIYEANKDLINDPDLIYPGQELKVPGA